MDLPAWFHEGFAIYFSGSGTSHAMLDRSNNTIYSVEATDEYEEYERTFLYLESRFNGRRFFEQLRNTVDEGDVTGLIDAVGLSSHEELRLAANFWWRWWPISEMTGWLYLLWLLPIPPALYLLLLRRQKAASSSMHRSALDIELFNRVTGRRPRVRTGSPGHGRRSERTRPTRLDITDVCRGVGRRRDRGDVAG